jgi:hypothetical protein
VTRKSNPIVQGKMASSMAATAKMTFEQFVAHQFQCTSGP